MTDVMTVGQLIEALKAFPADAPVVVHDGGHFGDYTDPNPQLQPGTMYGLGSGYPHWDYDRNGTTPGVTL